MDESAVVTAQETGARFRLDGKVALVTGAAGGIGCMASRVLGEAGARVALVDRDADALDDVTTLLGADGLSVVAHVADVAEEKDIAAAISSVATTEGQIDVLVNNAGVARRMPAEDMSLEAWNEVIRINLTGVFLCAREAGRYMLAAGRGSIINIASIMGHVGGALYGNLSYHASKGGVVNLTRALAVEWGARGVRVNAIAPTFVATKFTAPLFENAEIRHEIERLTPLGRVAEVDDLAGALLFLASPASSMVTGHSLAVDGGWLAR